MKSLKFLMITTLMVGFSQTLISSAAQAQVSPQQNYAVFMYQRLSGVTLQPDDPNITAMVALINQNNLLGAAQYVIAHDHGVFNNTVREVAAQQPIRTGVNAPNSPLTDYIADWIGVAYNGGAATSADARVLVTGNFYYMASAAAITQFNLQNTNLVNDILQTNNHYSELDSNVLNKNLDLAAVLVNAGPQMLVGADGKTAMPALDVAGSITSRGFYLGNGDSNNPGYLACGNMGTNRACVRNSIYMFEGIDIQTYADLGPDGMVTDDVNRAPPYQTSCQLCHNRLDSMKPAFALFDTDKNENFIEYALYNPNPCNSKNVDYSGTGHNSCSGQFDPNNIAIKENRNSQVFPTGFRVSAPTWTNTAASGTYQTMFGWGQAPGATYAATTGAGVNQFGQMLSSATAFGTNMATRFFTQICMRPPASDETATISALGANFQGPWKNDIQMLMAQIAILPDCLGTPGGS